MDKLTLPCPFTSVWEIPVVTEQLHMLLIVCLSTLCKVQTQRHPDEFLGIKFVYQELSETNYSHIYSFCE